MTALIVFLISAIGIIGHALAAARTSELRKVNDELYWALHREKKLKKQEGWWRRTHADKRPYFICAFDVAGPFSKYDRPNKGYSIAQHPRALWLNEEEADAIESSLGGTLTLVPRKDLAP